MEDVLEPGSESREYEEASRGHIEAGRDMSEYRSVHLRTAMSFDTSSAHRATSCQVDRRTMVGTSVATDDARDILDIY